MLATASVQPFAAMELEEKHVLSFASTKHCQHPINLEAPLLMLTLVASAALRTFTVPAHASDEGARERVTRPAATSQPYAPVCYDGAAFNTSGSSDTGTMRARPGAASAVNSSGSAKANARSHPDPRRPRPRPGAPGPERG